jgi:hypothetical protein
LLDFFNERGAEVGLFAHGACIGADVQAHAIARAVLGKKLLIAVYPSTARTRVFELDGSADYIAPVKSPLERNIDIVRAGRDLLIAAPLQNEEIRRSGTWSTVRIARRLGVPLLILAR